MIYYTFINDETKYALQLVQLPKQMLYIIYVYLAKQINILSQELCLSQLFVSFEEKRFGSIKTSGTFIIIFQLDYEVIFTSFTTF